MVILRTQNKITEFLMILAWASLFEYLKNRIILSDKYHLNYNYVYIYIYTDICPLSFPIFKAA